MPQRDAFGDLICRNKRTIIDAFIVLDWYGKADRSNAVMHRTMRNSPNQIHMQLERIADAIIAAVDEQINGGR
jgi:hypothetical protein